MPKVTLNHVRGNSYFCSGRLSVGVYINNNVATLIDSGIDKDNAKDIDKALKEAGLTVGAIINTHHHPDHCGGNNYFQKQYPNLKIFATRFESIFIDNPFVHVLCFCSSATPFEEFRNKYLEAESSRVTDVINPYHDQQISIGDASYSIVTLPGHTFGSIGVITPDNVFYSGDAIFGQETFTKHGVLFYTNIHDSLITFNKIAALPVDATVFYHGGLLTDSLAEVAHNHTQRMIATKDAIANIITTSMQPLAIDQITQQVMHLYNIPQAAMPFTLTRTCVQAYVTQLCLEKTVAVGMHNGLLTIQKI